MAGNHPQAGWTTVHCIVLLEKGESSHTFFPEKRKEMIRMAGLFVSALL
jgi:hypothetical protein